MRRAATITALAVVLLLAGCGKSAVQSCIDNTNAQHPISAHDQAWQDYLRQTCEFNVKYGVGTPEDGL